MNTNIVKDIIRLIDRVTNEDILENLGLQRRTSFGEAFLPGLGVFVAGVAVGAGISLLLAPKTGREMRDDLYQRMDSIRDQLEKVVRPGQGTETAVRPS